MPDRSGGEGGLYVVDYCSDPVNHVGTGYGVVVYHRRIYSHPACARGDIHSHTADQRAARGLKAESIQLELHGRLHDTGHAEGT